ncbi:hypothetical protein LZZ85_00580 [Terrimonas sp. NA20]|uniref:Uncharacterized protein n=1 Tax=Terrimonas ginsenosidimutans TaxID=2908004 RepID=A0ABS9KK97_9BACT|nr:hypothetical protein [Terrimonas ginsenosidimutans]MCG2612745.1 hypothetical protein [Terrimonas ginsenosidimutans]
MSTQTTVKPLPYFYVGADITDERINLFKNGKYVALTRELGKPDTRSIWYSKEHFEKLVEEIDLAGGDGIRVYFGTYEPGHEYEGQLCLLFRSTREDVRNNRIHHINVILENEPDYSARSEQEREILTFPGDDPTDQDVRDFNLGQACPPRCNGGCDDPTDPDCE